MKYEQHASIHTYITYILITEHQYIITSLSRVCITPAPFLRVKVAKPLSEIRKPLSTLVHYRYIALMPLLDGTESDSSWTWFMSNWIVCIKWLPLPPNTSF